MKKRIGFLLTAFLSGSATLAELPPLIPRMLLFGSPTNSKSSPSLSPNGKYLGYTALDPANQTFNVWIRTIGKVDDRVITQETNRPVFWYYWQPDSEHILYLQDQNGDENVHLYQVDLRTRSSRDLTPFPNVQAQIVSLDPNNEREMLVALNRKDPTRHDVYRLNFKSGTLALDTKNPGDVSEWVADNQLRVRAAQVTTPDGGTEIRVRTRPISKWRTFQRWGPDESPGWIQGFNHNNRRLWIVSSVGANARRLMEFDIASGKGEVVAQDPEYDVGEVQVHPKRHALEAVAVERARTEWTVIDQRLKTDFETLREARDGDFTVQSRDLADTKWIVCYDTDTAPESYYLYDRAARTTELLFFEGSPELPGYTFSPMRPISYAARDGLVIQGYLTLPAGVEPKNLPMVLHVHGGPWARTGWGFHYYAQWLANRGYAVLQVNFRGSTGYGKAFHNAGDREWGGKMQEDLIDAKRWAVAQGYADPARVAIMGHSYGGYAVLAGLAFTPDEFACGVDEMGPSNLITLLRSTPPHWTPMLGEFKRRIGDWEKDPESLKERSPIFKADQIKVPLFIVQGANDPRVKQAESDQIVQALRKNGKPVEYLLFPDEGHGTARPENDLKQAAAEEAFLARHLGGRLEPISDQEKCEELMR